MITHTEDPSKSGAHRADGFEWRHAARCGETLLGGGQEHTLSSADLADLAVEALCILSARDDTTEIRLAEVRRVRRMA
jgi:hypothetical protein